MKKMIALLLAMVLCLSLGAVGLADEEEAPEAEADEAAEEEAVEAADEEEAPDGETVEITAKNWEEYFVLAPEYEGKVTDYEIEDVQGSVTLKAAPSLDDAVEVPITLENWSSFFEITEEREEQEDAFGNVEHVFIDYAIDVREEYADHVVPTDSTVAFQVTATHVYTESGYTNNYPSDSTATYNPAELENDPWANLFDDLVGGEHYAPDGTLEIQDYEENITVTRVEGSIFLAGIDPEELEAAMHPPKEYAELAVGSSGDAVVALQQALIDQGFLTGAADGGYGNGTAAAVQAFQQSVGLEATGTADSATQRALFEGMTADAPADSAEPAAPAEEGPVEITMDNWSQYFEIIDIQQEEKNAFGEVETTRTYKTFALKNEYADMLDVEKENAVAVEVSYDYGFLSMGLTNATQDGAVDFSMDNMDDLGYHYGVIVSWDNNAEGMVTENITVTRIQGTIYLKP